MATSNKGINIKVIGIGGGGNNAVHSMQSEGIEGVEFIVMNTDEQVINESIVANKIVLGTSTKGQGAGADPLKGKQAANESLEEIRNVLKGSDLVILAAGMGGGTGTGASPIVGKIAKELGCLTIGVVTTPFKFEGTKRATNARNGIEELEQNVDSLIVVSNDKLLSQFGKTSLSDSFLYADKVLKQTVRTITDLISRKSRINLDFADVITVMKDKGNALVGIGRANGSDRAVKAATYAIGSPILESSIKGAKDAIINIAGKDNSITLQEVEIVMDTIRNAAGEDINIIFGTSHVENIGNDIQVSIIATGNKSSKTSDQSKTEIIKKDVQEATRVLEIEFEDEKTRELLISQPYSADDFSISDEIELHRNTSKNPFVDEDDDQDELPSFLRRK